MQERDREMSGYLSVQEYHQHEEKHVYYIEMVEQMIASGEAGGLGRAGRICELGAGTGLFTARLLQRTEADVVAVELDRDCAAILRAHLRPFRRRVKVVRGDSVQFREAERFELIFSSFADHHIGPAEREAYFANIRRLLAPGGMSLIGDEFLRAHDSEAERILALIDWHRHVIQDAARQGDAGRELVRLETAALVSGLHGIGDFKRSCEAYERSLKAAGFCFQRRRIGPAEDLGIGGVYVYCATAR